MDFNILCIVGFILSCILVVIIMPFFIKALKRRNINQVASQYALDEFKNKEKTPIMGGLLFVVLPVIAYIIINTNGLTDKKTLFVILSFVLYCLVGFSDDMLIILRNNNDGLSPITRLLMELGITVGLFFIFKDIIPMQVTIPFTTISISINPIIFVCFMSLLYMAEANAVNFTDGMDGLCAGVSFIGLIAFLIILIIRKAFPLFNKIFPKYDKLNESVEENVNVVKLTSSQTSGYAKGAKNQSMSYEISQAYRSVKASYKKGDSSAKDLGRYALKDRHEYFAEGVSAYMSGLRNKHTIAAYNIAKKYWK